MCRKSELVRRPLGPPVVRVPIFDAVAPVKIEAALRRLISIAVPSDKNAFAGTARMTQRIRRGLGNHWSLEFRTANLRRNTHNQCQECIPTNNGALQQTVDTAPPSEWAR